MNPVLKAAAESVQFAWVMGLMTILFLVVFLGWALWAWQPANRDRMQRAAAMPLEDEPEIRP
jgi:cbb3-type cytochrome oxidase subunit 3